MEPDRTVPPAFAAVGPLRWLPMLAMVAGGCSAEGNLSVGEVCEEIVPALCDRSVECSVITPPERDECVESYVAQCCEIEERCEEESVSNQEEVDVCVEDLGEVSCADFIEGPVASCLQIATSL